MTATLEYTPVQDIEKIRATLKHGFDSGKMRSLEYRKYAILQLGYLVADNKERLLDALHTDLGKSRFEGVFLDLGYIFGEVRKAHAQLVRWAAPERAPFDVNWIAMRPKVHKCPKGTVVIFGPFNAPYFSVFPPLIGALAAGNTVLLKPSELSAATSALLAELIPQYLPPDVIAVVNGGVEQASQILELQWDHILYTGGCRVGKIVAAAAAKHLTPVSLELGGKNPAIIDSSVDMTKAARRLLWGRIANCGQLCTAPDYVLVPRGAQDKLVAALKDVHTQFFPRGAALSPDHGRIINDAHFRRVKGLLDATRGTVVLGGETDAATRFIAPTVVTDVGVDDSLMSEEIFGPVLPIVPVEDIDGAIAVVNRLPRPLGCYVFTNDNKIKKKVFENTMSGGFAVNESVLWTPAEGLPFGGTGNSGYGYHTGKYSFDMFTHLRAAIDAPFWLDTIALGFRYPPFTPKAERTADQLSPWTLPRRPVSPPDPFAPARSRGAWWRVPALLALLSAALAVLLGKWGGVDMVKVVDVFGKALGKA